MPTTPSFLAVQVRDVQRSVAFYRDVLGFAVADHQPSPAATVMAGDLPFALREPLVDLDAVSALGHGVALWFACDDVDAAHARALEAGADLDGPPRPGPFGRMVVVTDPDGYHLTLHG